MLFIGKIGVLGYSICCYFLIVKDYHLIFTLTVGIPPQICSTLCRPLRLGGPTRPTPIPTLTRRLPLPPPRPHRNQ